MDSRRRVKRMTNWKPTPDEGHVMLDVPFPGSIRYGYDPTCSVCKLERRVCGFCTREYELKYSKHQPL
jgi:hypothetical protein